MKQFKVGETYTCRSIGDYDCIFKIEVISRTEKTIKVKTNLYNEVKSFRVYDKYTPGIEQVRLGSYSMAPIFRAA